MLKLNKKRLYIIYILQIISTYLLNYYYQNNFWVLSTYIALLILLGLLIVTIKFLILLEIKQNRLKVKIDSEVIPTKIRKMEMTKVNRRFKKYRMITYIVFAIFILIPLGTSYYEEHTTKKIYTINDFKQIKNNPNGSYVLMNNIDFGTYTTTANQCNEKNTFDGQFNGNNHTISHLKQPLFYCIGKSGHVNHLILSNVQITSNDDNIGALTKYNYGSINHVFVDGSISGNLNVGGIVGQNLHSYVMKRNTILINGTINLSSFTGTINGNFNVGGITGYNVGEISQVYVKANIEGENSIGGITGENYGGLIDNCFTQSNITGNSMIGGVIGYNVYVTDHISQCIILGNITSQDASYLLGYYTYSETSLFMGDVDAKEIVNYFPVFVYDKSNVTDHQLSNIIVVSDDSVYNQDWYMKTLKFNRSRWDFSDLNNGHLPTLKGIPNQNN